MCIRDRASTGRGGGSGRGSDRGFTGKCFECNKPGHRAAQCPKRAAKMKGKGKRGHIAALEDGDVPMDDPRGNDEGSEEMESGN